MAAEPPTDQFPGDWPEDCPPGSALPASETVFRVCKCLPPLPSDFLSQFELGKAFGGDDCRRAGLSVCLTYDGALQLMARLPHLGEFIAKARLAPSAGRLMPTPSRAIPAHATWWPYEYLDRCSLFGPAP